MTRRRSPNKEILRTADSRSCCPDTLATIQDNKRPVQSLIDHLGKHLWKPFTAVIISFFHSCVKWPGCMTGVTEVWRSVLQKCTWTLLTVTKQPNSGRDRDPLTHTVDKRRFPTFSAPTLAISLFVDPTDQNWNMTVLNLFHSSFFLDLVNGSRGQGRYSWAE